MQGVCVLGEFMEDRPVTRKDGSEVVGLREVLVNVGRKYPVRVSYFVEDTDGEVPAVVQKWQMWVDGYHEGDTIALGVHASGVEVGGRKYVNYRLRALD